jgi:hypothetical protein
METSCEIGSMQYTLFFDKTSKRDFTLYQGSVSVNPVLYFSFCKWHKYKTDIFSPFDVSDHIKAIIINAIERCEKEEIVTEPIFLKYQYHS